MSYPKVLFTTVWRSTTDTAELYDYLDSYILDKSMYRYSNPRHISYGLRFLKENFPFIDILEYPTEKEFSEKLNESWDIIGFSFYSNETNAVLKMVHNAKTTIPNTKIWAGNYGALDPSIQHHFDRIFIGYAEQELSQIFKYPLQRIIHPPLISRIEDSKGRPLLPVGILFTTRGCKMKCDFCQTVSFSQKSVSLIDHESIDAVLSFYQRHGIRDIMILDENFGIGNPVHTKEVIRMCETKELNWYCLTTMRTADKFQQDANNKHFAGAFIAIESFARQFSKN